MSNNLKNILKLSSDLRQDGFARLAEELEYRSFVANKYAIDPQYVMMDTQPQISPTEGARQIREHYEKLSAEEQEEVKEFLIDRGLDALGFIPIFGDALDLSRGVYFILKGSATGNEVDLLTGIFLLIAGMPIIGDFVGKGGLAAFKAFKAGNRSKGIIVPLVNFLRKAPSVSDLSKFKKFFVYICEMIHPTMMIIVGTILLEKAMKALGLIGDDTLDKMCDISKEVKEVADNPSPAATAKADEVLNKYDAAVKSFLQKYDTPQYMS